MGSHFTTRSVNKDGSFRDLTKQYNSSSDISPTGGQMPTDESEPLSDYIFEPSMEQIVSELVPKSLGNNTNRVQATVHFPSIVHY